HGSIATGRGGRGRRGDGSRRGTGARLHERSGADGRGDAQRRQLGVHPERIRGGIRVRAGGQGLMALTDLLVAVAIGFAFGVALERAGLGSARKLTGQFFLRDFTVFKVMFTAIVTAALGLFWLGRFGIIDWSRLYVPETFLLPQVTGGLIFGAGFALAGLCPGTSCVAAARGRGDGAAGGGGLFAGVAVTG